jgi:V8-like Glu-specific endopeptidase
MFIVFFLVLAAGSGFCQDIVMQLEEQLSHTTVQIITIDFESKDTSSGTGFFCELTNAEGLKKNVIVTNRHVIKNQDKGFLIFNHKVGGKVYGNKEILTINNFEKSWIQHPDSLVDLAIIDLDQIINLYSSKGVELFTMSIPESLFVSDSILGTLSILEDVVMIGYPIGLSDYVNNNSIARTGATASQPKLDYQGTQEFLIDIASFPGSSGSPVFLKKTRTGFKNVPNTLSIGIEYDYQLLGILYSGPTYIPQSKEMKFSTVIDLNKNDDIQIPVNLGRAIKSKRILDFKKIIFSKK